MVALFICYWCYKNRLNCHVHNPDDNIGHGSLTEHFMTHSSCVWALWFPAVLRLKLLEKREGWERWTVLKRSESSEKTNVRVSRGTTEYDRGQERRWRRLFVGKVVYCPAVLQCINYKMFSSAAGLWIDGRQTDSWRYSWKPTVSLSYSQLKRNCRAGGSLSR